MNGERFSSGVAKLDGLLGGGFVEPSSILVTGARGVGKSTLLMHACIGFAAKDRRVLYITGDASLEQVAQQFIRLPGARRASKWIDMAATKSVPEAMGTILDFKPHLVVVDSIASVGDPAVPGVPGGAAQAGNCVRSVLKCLAEYEYGIALFAGHEYMRGLSKIEHAVDTVLVMQSEEAGRVVVGARKNRFGVLSRASFVMTENGLR